jgi:hypothetical protein
MAFRYDEQFEDIRHVLHDRCGNCHKLSTVDQDACDDM